MPKVLNRAAMSGLLLDSTFARSPVSLAIYVFRMHHSAVHPSDHLRLLYLFLRIQDFRHNTIAISYCGVSSIFVFRKFAFIIAFLAHMQSVKSVLVQLGVRKGLCFPIFSPCIDSSSCTYIYASYSLASRSALRFSSCLLASASVLRIRMA